MNQKTIRLLDSYALHTDQSKKEVRKLWKSLNWQEKTKERKRIKKELAEE